MIQLYTGDGKGKTTAALGAALRAAGAGKKVFIAQFCKGRKYSELNAIKKIKNIRLEQFGTKCFINNKPSSVDFRQAKRGIEKVREVIENKQYQMIILDEICIAIYYKLVPLEEVLTLCKKVGREAEIILTGRNAPKELIKQADLVSYISEIKHYYHKGIKARRGIEF
ncbi:MAG: cob(I)yrinic acid a,c-diamide adenosyltransferase [Candidatus Omnitrophica bacterium]|nr:cob(I)yrinic acid a,c-diamide adenosyltransferase [Candidatus Omnitrophota bacterium]